MKDQFRQGISVEDFQKPLPFFGGFPADPCLDGKPLPCLLQPAAYFVQKTVQAVRVLQESGSFASGDDSAGGTAEIQIDLPVTVPGEFRRKSSGRLVRIWGISVIF